MTNLLKPPAESHWLSVNVTTHESFDVIVVGGGVSGAIAGIAAARSGSRTLVIEEQGFLGGSLTTMGVGPMMSFHNIAGRQVIRGLAQELIERLQHRGASPGHIPDTTTYCSTVTPFDAEALKIELESMLLEVKGEILYHSQLAGASVGHEEIESIVVCNKAGLSQFRAAVFIDATGDGDLAFRAGASFQQGRLEDSVAQPMTMNLKLANVDVAAIRAYALANPDDFLWENNREEALHRLRTSPRLSLAGYLSEWRAAQAEGEIDIPRDQLLFFETATPGVVVVNTSRIQGMNATDPFQLSRAEALGRQQCQQLFDFVRKRCIGFENALRIDAAAKIGVRESRHICGSYILTADDLLRERRFDDCIALGGYPIDIHSPDGTATITRGQRKALSYQVPLRCMLPPNVNNLIVVGRCISATHEAAAAIRVTPIAMAIGHAGGVVAGEASRLRCSVGKVPFALVRSQLLAQSALLE